MWLQYNNQRYPLDQLPTVHPTANTNFDKAIRFCRAWQDGVQEFEFHTSGSTGNPKKIVLTRKQLTLSALKTINAVGLAMGETSLISLDVQFIAGRMMLVRSLVAGMNMVVTEPSSNPFETLDSQVIIDFTALIPYQVQTILSSPEKDRFNQIKSLLIGGAPLDQKTKARLMPYATTFYETYGMTETISHIALRRVNGSNPTDHFEVLPGISIDRDERGCLVIEADYLGSSPLITNDLIEILTPHSFEWLGRADYVINTGGIKVHPEQIEGKIEAILNKLHIPHRFFITGLPDAQLGSAVTLLMEGRTLEDELLGTLKDTIKAVLTKYEVPRAIYFVPAFITTETGKVNRLKTIQDLKTTQY